MVKISFKLPFFGDSSETGRLKFSEIMSYLDEKFKDEISESIYTGKEKCRSIEEDFNSIIKDIRELDSRGTNIFSTSITKIQKIKTPDIINSSTLSEFLITSSDVAKQINSLSPTSKTISNYPKELSSIATKLTNLFKKTKNLQEFLKESETLRKYGLIKSEIEKINEIKDRIEELKPEIKAGKEKHDSYSTAEIDMEIKKLRGSRDIVEYDELNKKFNEIEERTINVKNELTSVLGEIKKPMKKILYETGGNKIIESCYEDPLECLSHENTESEFSKAISLGLISLREKLDEEYVKKLKSFSSKFNRDFIQKIKEKMQSIENEKKEIKKMLATKSEIFEKIRTMEDERNEIVKKMSKIGREIRDITSEIEKLEKQIEEHKRKISNMLKDLINEKIEII